MSIKRNIVFLCLLILFSVFSCDENRKISNIQNQWSGLNPTSIPLGVRMKEVEKGNLITNPSFELGKHYMIDSTRLSFNIPGWRKLGESVFWTNTENKVEFEESDASSGIHAIKIIRKTSNETDIQGEGIITDYIRVIPGNYLLSLDVKLSHIKSNLERLGVGIYDAINLRVYCYDRNKVMIKNTAIHPLYNTEIDNSFKGFSFSNHEKIEDFGWANIFGRAGNFPFEEGSLPEETRYVKIFAGLKGEGIMWIDRVDFRYSQKNFTLLEQLEPYFDTIMERSRYLIPSPQQAEYYKNIPLIISRENEKQLFPRLLLPLNADKQTRDQISGFVSRLPLESPNTKSSLQIITRFDSRDMEPDALVFSFGYNVLSSQFSDQLPFDEIQGLNQAYFVKRLTQLPNVIFIGFSDVEGLSRGLHTLHQLFDFKQNTYHHYDIVDYPDFESRGIVIKLDNIDELKTDIIPGAAYISGLGANCWVLESPPFQLGSNELFQRFNDWIRFDFSKYNFPYIRKGLSLEQLKMPAFPDKITGKETKELLEYQKTISESARNYYDKLKRLKDNDFDLIIFSDKTLWESMNTMNPGSMILNQENFARFMFYRNIFTSSFSMNDIKDLPDSYLIPFHLEVARQGSIYSQIYESALSDTMVNRYFSTVLWSGPVKGADLIDPVDLHSFGGSGTISFIDYSLMFRTESTYFGNYYSLYPGKALSGAIFKPYETKMTGITPEDLNREVFLKVDDFSEVTQLRLATAVDFLWNNSHYDPAFSIWKSLVYKYGRDVAKELVLFNDLYYKLLSISLDFDLNGYNQKLEKQGEELIIQLNSHWDKIKVSLADHIEFLNELSDLKNTIITNFYQSNKNSLKNSQ
jgi:hypothetical protein